MVSEHSVQELAFIGRVALGARTPREALDRIVLAIPYHCSHEIISVTSSNQSVVLSEGWSLAIGDLELHIIHQYFVAIIQRICAFTRLNEPLLSAIGMLPHPELGFEHLKDRFEGRLLPSPDRLVRVTISNAVADRRFFEVARDRNLHKLFGKIENLNFDGSLSTSAKAVLGLQFLDGAPGIARLAQWAGISQRTLQRRLSDENTSFSALLETVRRDMALQDLSTGHETMDSIAARLGYERQSTFTRAVRRWTGKTPSQIRNEAGGSV